MCISTCVLTYMYDVRSLLFFRGQVLRFDAFFKESVTESEDECFRLRKVLLLFDVSDSGCSM